MLKLFDAVTLSAVEELALGDSSVVSLCWHGELNQIFAGCNDGSVKVLYDVEAYGSARSASAAGAGRVC